MNDSYASAITQLLHRQLEQANARLATTFSLPVIAFDLKGKSAGQCVFNKRSPVQSILRFNLGFCEQYAEAFIAQTPAHELAHYLTYRLFGVSTRKKKVLPHGKEWKYIMQDILDVKPLTYHAWETKPARKIRYFPFTCECEGRLHELSSIRQNRMLTGKVFYRCVDCRNVLVPVSA